MAKRIRGNFNPEMISGRLRQGDNNVVLMFGGGTSVAGNAIIFDANGNAIDAGSSGTAFYGYAAATAAAGNNQITLGSSPLTNSIRVFVNGVLKAPSAYTIVGAVVTLTPALAAADVVVVAWVTLNATPGTIALATNTGPIAIRGTGIQASSASSYTVTFPSGTLAGDLAMVCVGHAWIASTPTGWTSQSNLQGANWQGAVFTKILASGDITTGSVTVNFSGSFDGVLAIITFVGNTAGIRETVASRASGTSSPLTTSSGVLTTDMAVYFGSNRGASTDTVDRGTSRQTANNGASASGCLYTEVIPAAAAQTANFLYSVAGLGNYQSICVVKSV